MSLASRRPRIPILPLSADLTKRILDELIYERICELPHADGIPALEYELIETIEEVRRPEDPPAQLIASGLILKGLETVQDVLEAEDRAHAISGGLPS